MAQTKSKPAPALDEFEGSDVREVAVKITKAGDGLSDALKVAPVALHRGAEVFYLLKGLVTQVSFKEVKPGSEDLVRVHTVTCQSISEVPAEMADPILRDAGVAIRARLDEMNGIVSLPFTGDGDGLVPFDALPEDAKVAYVAHGNGKHASGPVDGCPLCTAPPARARRSRKKAE